MKIKVTCELSIFDWILLQDRLKNEYNLIVSGMFLPTATPLQTKRVEDEFKEKKLQDISRQLRDYYKLQLKVRENLEMNRKRALSVHHSSTYGMPDTRFTARFQRIRPCKAAY